VTFDETGKPLADSKIPWKRFDTASACVSSTVKSNIANGVHPDLDVRAALRVWCAGLIVLWEGRALLGGALRI
jgi:hypothetical protein